MNVPRKPEGVRQAESKLDQAIREYFDEVSKAWENDNPGMIVGWIAGMALTRIEEGDEEDNLMIVSSPGINNYLARGVADATAESFQMQATGWGEIDDGVE